MIQFITEIAAITGISFTLASCGVTVYTLDFWTIGALLVVICVPRQLQASAMRSALQRIADGPDTDSVGVVAITMKNIARSALGVK